ncbi:hypothetical protein FB388_5440 [Pseudonocardia cypriaca]|uniref:Uncharacterized protein n=1 Tax=Pseudonocardia cypriaca TaxID=882449 RepID=A0A543FWJ8_9PSEU|nr:hypothetical protein FB388_5440 [Pseudonocardia cypriaca]
MQHEAPYAETVRTPGFPMNGFAVLPVRLR